MRVARELVRVLARRNFCGEAAAGPEVFRLLSQLIPVDELPSILLELVLVP